MSRRPNTRLSSFGPVTSIYCDDNIDRFKKKKKKEKNLFGCKMYDNAVKSTLCVTKVGLCDGVRPSETSVSK